MDKPKSDDQIRTETLIKSLMTQRNTALNFIADLQAEIAVLQEKLKERDAKDDSSHM